jgi:fibulin 1/2
MVFVANNYSLDATDYGIEDWERVKLTLSGSANSSAEKIGYSMFLERAVSTGRLTLSKSHHLKSSVSEEIHVSDTEVTVNIIRRPGSEVNLTDVLLALGYRNEGRPDHVPRLILIEVLDLNGLSAPAVGFTVTYVGENVNGPVITVRQATARFIIGSRELFPVTNGSLTVFDLDHPYYAMQSGKIAILQAVHAERISLKMENPGVVISENQNGTVITLQGAASTEAYTELFNNVTYSNWDSNATESNEIIVTFEITDGIHFGNSAVKISKVVRCPPLIVPANGEMSNSETVCNTTTYFTCNKCYNMTGASSLSCLCFGAKWDGEVPECTLVHCPVLEAPSNGIMDSTNTTCDTVVQFRCNDSYELFGSSTLTCLTNGQWDNSVPKCYGRCPHLEVPAKGSISTTSTVHNTTVYFNCDACYVLNGNSNLTCQQTGAWNGNVPHCQVGHCTALSPPSRGSLSTDETSCNTTVKVECDECYSTMSAADSLTCLPELYWDNDVPTCQLIHCSELDAPSNGTKAGTETACRSVISFTCDVGLELKGSSQRECMSDGTWSGDETICDDGEVCSSFPCQNGGDCLDLPIGYRCVCKPGFSGENCDTVTHCRPLNAVENGSYVVNGSTVGNLAHFRCDNECYELVGSGTISCQEDGTWNATEPLCSLVLCDLVKPPLHGRSSNKETNCGSTSRVFCDECYAITGLVDELTCLPNGSYDHEVPSCNRIHCPPLLSPHHGWKSSNDTTCNSTVDFGCLEGFSLTGKSRLVCLANKSWNAINPHCEDMDECESFPCENNGTCVNTIGSYSCICTAYFLGSHCGIPADNMYSYGPSQRDLSLPRLDDFSHGPITIPLSCFPFGVQRHYAVYVSTNGYISFDRAFASPYPTRFPGFIHTSLVAPFWSDVDIRKEGNVFYNVYLDTKSSYIERATHEVRRFSRSGSFTARWVLVVTWDRVPNYPDGSGSDSDSLSSKRNTYQIVIATDGQQTFALFNYPSDGLQWSGRAESAVVGYTTRDASSFRNHYLSTFPDVVEIATRLLPSNINRTGRLFYQLSDDSNVCAVNSHCINWYLKDIDEEGVSPVWHMFLRPCPCSLFQASRDWRYRLQNTTETSTCYVSTFPSYSTTQTECCYSVALGGLLIGSPQGGTANRYHSSFDSLHNQFDVKPHRDCCVSSDLCRLYYQRRPSQTCVDYRPPFWAWFWGDPHISTLDGKQYTFNGIGEYILMKTVGETFVLEGRTRLVENSSATVFSAFSMAQFEDFSQSLLQSTVIHTELMSDHTLRVMVCCYTMSDDLTASSSILSGSHWRDVTEEFFHLNNISHLALYNVVLARPGNAMLVAAFSSGISVTVEVKKGLLTVVFAAPEAFKGDTKGLLGVWDDDVSNDLTSRSGIAIHVNSTDRQIHSLAQTWQVYENESLFYYDVGTGVSTFADPDHIPVFADETLDRYTEQQRLACNNDPQCLFDTFETNDPEVGQETLITNTQLVQQSMALMDFPPSLNGTDVLEAIIGQVTTYFFVGTDTDAFNVTLEGIRPPEADYTLTRDGDNFTFTWIPTSSAVISLLFIANDTTGLSSRLQPLIRLCACRLDKNATCEPSEGDGGTQRFVLDDCECGSGWEGKFCGVDIDACSISPCPEGTDCTDKAAPDTGFDCGSCSPGLQLVEGKCEDVDECSNDTLNNCDQVCSNKEPFFSCECLAGYRLESNGVKCSDIDECEDDVPCHHMCNNVPGSFWCSCNSGFRLSIDNISCIPENLCIMKAAECEHICSRNGSTDIESCSCYRGYRLDADDGNCSDIDECSEMLDVCEQECANTDGSFLCRCRDGYRLHSNGHACQDVNECVENGSPCNISGQVCTNLAGAFNCSCPPGTENIDGACRIADDCASHPCLNDAVCLDGVAMFKCSCSSGYSGSLCEEEVNECASDPCQNNGTCFDKVDRFECNCVAGYEETVCQRETDECHPMPCFNGATCHDFHLSFTCQCGTGFTGDLCETDVDECSSEPCRNAIDCEDGVNSFTCHCLPGYLGVFCETDVDDCFSSPCQNKGTCLDRINMYDCKCLSGYTGMNCESEIDECVSSPCLNDGSCTDEVDAYTCSCSSGYNGRNCEIDINECASSPCQNNAICSDLVDAFVCTCAGLYKGTLCEIETSITFPCSDVFVSSNCTEFVECLEAAFPCSNSYFKTFLLPFCQLENTTTTSKTWASSASSCLIAQIQEFFESSYTASPSPSECTRVQLYMLRSQGLCLNVSLCNSNMSSVDADAVSQVFALSAARHREENIQQLLNLVDLCPSHSLDTLTESLTNVGFVICLRTELSIGENRTSVQMTALTQLQDLIVKITGETSDLSAIDPNICPLTVSIHDGQRHNIVETGQTNNTTDAQRDTVIYVAILSRGENAISTSDLCNHSTDLGNTILTCPACGNGILDSVDEYCDDGNNMTGDGCSIRCVIEPGYDCNTNVAPNVCFEKTCGDGIRVSGEDCDNRIAPGCSGCLIVQGFTCHTPFFEGSVCFSCGNAIVEESEECDNGPGHDIDGCDNVCTVNDLWECTSVVGQQSVCEHSAVDMNPADQTTLDPPVIIYDPNLLMFFLVQDHTQLDTGSFNSTV